MPNHLVLVGMRCVGKSSVGAECATLFKREYIDLDERICAQSVLPVTNITDCYRQLGERSFRALERQAMLSLIQQTQPAVIALGGGTVQDAQGVAQCRALGKVIHLSCDVSILYSRWRARPPAYCPQPSESAIQALLSKRLPHLKAAADMTLDVSHHSVKQAAEAIWLWWQENVG